MIREPKPFDPNFPRYCPQRNFPPYRFVPGLNPRPIEHCCGSEEHNDTATFTPDQWAKNENYLYGVDLFNYAFWWEAHEAWEGDWLYAHGDQRQFLQGLIKISAALIKRNSRQLRGVQNHARSGIEKLNSVAENHRFYMGIDLPKFIDLLQKFFDPFFGEINDQTFEKISVKPLINLITDY